MNIFWPTITGLAAILTIVLWARENLKEKPRLLIYPVLIVLLTIFSTWTFNENIKLKNIKNEAEILSSSWPTHDRLAFLTKGERIGIILAGLAFLEKHQEYFPETYIQSKKLIENRVKNFQAPTNRDISYKEYDLLEDVAGAMIQLIKSISR